MAKQVAIQAPSAMDTARSNGMIFEIGFTFLFTHYISIFQGFVRCLFQSFRPLLILFVFGQRRGGALPPPHSHLFAGEQVGGRHGLRGSARSFIANFGASASNASRNPDITQGAKQSSHDRHTCRAWERDGGPQGALPRCGTTVACHP